MGLDPKLERRFKVLERENRSLKIKIDTLGKAGQSAGNSATRGIKSLLRMSTINKISNKHLYIGGRKITPLGPNFRKRRLF